MKNHKLVIVTFTIALLAFGTVGAINRFPWGTIQVSPNTGLTDGQTVQVSGSNFKKNLNVHIIECGPILTEWKGGWESATCTSYEVLVTTDANGNLPATNFTVATTINGFKWSHGHNVPATYDCLTHNDCHIHVFAYNGPGSANQDISFALPPQQ